MTNSTPRLVRLGFERDFHNLDLDLLHCAVALPDSVKNTVKYRQIRASVEAIGLVEPIVVAHSPALPGSFLVLDGRLRFEILRDMGVAKAMCLVSTDDEGYTYNKRVNRLSVVQEHRMIVLAAGRGVSVEQLAQVLNVSAHAIRQQFRLLDGVCSEAIALLADKPTTYGTFRVLKRMKAFRQIDVAQAMVNLGKYSTKLATAMLQATPPEQLTEQAAARATKTAPVEALQRLERELAAVQADTRLLEEGYGPANLQLEIIKTYIGKTLLENASVVRWLAKNRGEYLQQLQIIADIKALPMH
ncbi:ParB/RepB/Spo0J family partition protein [Pseudacidovorax intermedius]|uniref:ParB/RepB/Spo0J family partition protein n=1 Tax=Pseudacidovorax intermedius TaxID=433924 RepID=UPI0005BD1117|nr:plasmid partitioning protein RepB C-terminal domain-containing protein [Pseudacidovorax intermedius]